MDSQSAQTKESSKEIDAILQETAALSAAFGRARILRFVVILLVLVYLGAIGYLLWNKGKRMTDPKRIEAYGNAATKYLETHNEKYMRDFHIFAERIRPPLTKAFTEQTQKDMPRYLKAVEKERGPFLDRLQQGFDTKLTKRYDSLQSNYEKLFKNEFPTIQDEKLHAKMMKNFDTAMQGLLKKYYVQDLKAEMDQLYHTWDHFPIAAAPSKGEPSAEDQLIAALIELASHRVMHSQGIGPVR